MKCKDLQDLLVSYANGELHGPQKDLIEEHLNSCRECREALYDYAMTREWLLTLRETPGLPEIKEENISKVRTIKLRAGFRHWLRLAVIAVPLLVITIYATLFITGAFDCTSGVIAKAYAAGSTLKSFHYVKDEYTQDAHDVEPVHSYHAEVDYSTPDRYRMSFSLTGFPSETIRIGDEAYTNASTIIKFEPEWYDQFSPDNDRMLGILTLLQKTETLDDEVINGTLCYHYIGEVDIDKYLAWSRPAFEQMYYRMDRSLPNGMLSTLDSFIKQCNSNYLDQDMTFEFWIGKNDYLLRQAKLVYQTKDGEHSVWNDYKSISVLRYTDFNQAISIEAPLNENGELLKGWKSYPVEPLEIPASEATDADG